MAECLNALFGMEVFRLSADFAILTVTPLDAPGCRPTR